MPHETPTAAAAKAAENAEKEAAKPKVVATEDLFDDDDDDFLNDDGPAPTKQSVAAVAAAVEPLPTGGAAAKTDQVEAPASAQRKDSTTQKLDSMFDEADGWSHVVVLC